MASDWPLGCHLRAMGRVMDSEWFIARPSLVRSYALIQALDSTELGEINGYSTERAVSTTLNGCNHGLKKRPESDPWILIHHPFPFRPRCSSCQLSDVAS
jgi:hypothetical protein